MNGVTGTKPDRLKWNRLLGAVLTINKYNKSTTDHSIYIRVLSGGTVSYCRNMYGHTLMGHPAARLETMALVIRSYVVE